MVMQLTHDFVVPASIEETWNALNDIEGVAGCFPGAAVTGVEGDSFEGTCKVKLGPIALVYNGAGAFVEKDSENHRMKIEAKGKDKRGNGTAGADVTATMVAVEDGTRVTVVTELAITGKPAQFGRGVMQDVSDKLLAQFAQCLARRLAPAPAESAPEAGASEAGASEQGTPVADSSVSDAPPPTPLHSAGSAAGSGSTAGAGAEEDDALDLGTALLPVLVKNYWRQALAAVVGLVVLRGLIRRIRR